MNDITALIADLPDLRQDKVKAELDHLASLGTPQGMTAAEQICSAQHISLEGLQGIQDVLLMLAIDHPKILERVSVQASLMQRTGGKSWSAFQFDDDGKPWALGDKAARAGFVADAIAILDLPDHRQREADWYTAIRVNPITGEETEILQATIYDKATQKANLPLDRPKGWNAKSCKGCWKSGSHVTPKTVSSKFARMAAKRYATNTQRPFLSILPRNPRRLLRHRVAMCC